MFDSFSVVHVLAYTIIALQQIYLNVHWSPIYWQTAVLTVNSGSKTVDDDGKQSTRDYGKTAKAIAGLREQGTQFATPLINSSSTDFTPDADNNRILFALKGIRGMNDETVRKVIEGRPYKDSQDFFDRIAPRKNDVISRLADEHFKELGIKVKKSSKEYVEFTKVLKEDDKRLNKSQVITLIKAGAFREFGETPTQTMQKFVKHYIELKQSLNGQNTSRAIKLGIFDKEGRDKYKHVYNLRAELRKNKDKKADVLRTRSSMYKDILKKLFPPNVICGEDGQWLLVDETKFEKAYEKYKEEIQSVLALESTVKEFNINTLMEEWESVASGSEESWEMDTIVFYSDKHEMDYVDKELYNITPLKEIPPSPVVTSTYKWRGSIKENYKLFTIMGTVVDKNKDKARFTVVTPDGVVTCKTYKGAFSHYDKQVKTNGEIVDKSWFTRGTRLLMWGYLKDDMFILKAPKDTHTLARVDYIDRESGRLSLSLEKVYNN